MKKIIAFLPLMFCLVYVTTAQRVAAGEYPFHKKVKATAYGLQMEVEAVPEYVSAVLAEQFKNASGQKPRAFKAGLMLVEAANIPKISSATLDYYYRVEPAGKKTASHSVVTLFLSAGNYNILDMPKYKQEIAAAKSWMQEVVQDISAYGMEMALKEQQDRLKEIEKELQKLKKEQQDLQKEQQKIHEALLKNTENQTEKAARLKEEQARLANMQQNLRRIK